MAVECVAVVVGLPFSAFDFLALAGGNKALYFEVIQVEFVFHKVGLSVDKLDWLIRLAILVHGWRVANPRG